jgi:3-oxoacyl-[acyl-carrier protein] reductase
MPGHVLVSGGSRGLGAAVVRGLLQRGDRVSLCSRKPTEFTASLAGHPLACFVSADLADHDEIARFVSEAEGRLGPPTGLVNCGAIAADGVLATLAPSAIESMTRVNIVGTILLTREVVRRMLTAGQGGAIVNVSSVGGLRGFSGLSAYGATKAALDGFTRGLASA